MDQSLRTQIWKIKGRANLRNTIHGMELRRRGYLCSYHKRAEILKQNSKSVSRISLEKQVLLGIFPLHQGSDSAVAGASETLSDIR